jgi:eukaryotic-like serine/threonine-protein kinase
MIGSKLGYYQILEQIGAGGMGVVYRARDERLDRTVAIKVLPPGLLADEGARRRFRQEALALARINHPNIATLHDTGSENGTDYLVMEYIPGTTLEAQGQAGLLQVREVISLAIQIAEGLAAAHDRGIIHRDLKPGNLRLTPDGRVKILDFGLARRAPGPSALGTTVTASEIQQTSGTIPYMAPEQLQGRPADARSDLWGLGVVLYELSCGRRPFPGNVPTAIAADIIHQQPAPPRSLRSEIPTPLEKMILKCLQKDPSQRYVSARALLQDLEELRNADATVHPPAPVPVSSSESLAMEIAHVLFTDIVSYSTLPMDEQERALRELQQAVRSTSEFTAAQLEDRLIRLPTGDGMALVFFGDPEAPVRCALQLARLIKDRQLLKLRMGINSGPVYRVADINAARNVAGGGINMAQRVMDCGDAGHILISKSAADVLAQLTSWRGSLYDLGEAEVKHGVRIRVFNLYHDGVGNPHLPRKLQRTTSHRRATWAGIAALLLTMSIAAWLLANYVKARPAIGARRSIAVLGFKNLTGKTADDWMSAALSEMLTNELAAGEQLRAISGEDVTRARLDLHLPESETLSHDTLAQVKRRLESDLVVVGSYFDVNGELRVDVHLQDAAAGNTIANLSETRGEAQLFDLVSRIGSSLRAHSGVRDLTPTQAASLRASKPTNAEGARVYAEGLERLREFDPAGARDKLEAAIAVDANNAMAHSALASAWSQLGYDARAAAEAKTAFDLSANLSREDHLTIEGAYYVTGKQWNKAIDVYRTLFGFFPDNLEYGLNLADAQVSGGKAQDALVTVSKMREPVAAGAADPRLDLAEARAAAALSDYRLAEAASSRAAVAAARQGSHFERGQAILQRCVALRRLGQFEDAKHEGQQAQEIFADNRYARGQAGSLTCVANVLRDQGDLAGAQQMFEKALSRAESIGARMDIAGALNNLGIVLADLGQLEQSNNKYGRALSVAIEIGDQPDQLKAQSNIGTNLMVLGQFRSAQKVLQDSLQLAQAIGDRQGGVESLINLGIASYSLGSLDQAEKQLNDALVSSQTLGFRSDAASALDPLGDVLMAKDDLAGAEHSYREALALRKQLNQQGALPVSQISLAGLSLERGDLPGADAMARDAARQAHEGSDAEQELLARNLLARALLGQGKLDAANTELQAAAELSARDETAKLTWGITYGQLFAARGRTAEARRAMSRALQQAKKMEYIPGQLQTRIALAELQIRSGDRKGGVQELQSLAKDATKLHFLLAARRAHELQVRAAATISAQ